ncbi:hypothetical protein EV145_10772 [Flavobacterium sp. 245]|nr:hypothetical protein EV145_10772 [Flavobacterium sp. 245]
MLTKQKIKSYKWFLPISFLLVALFDPANLKSYTDFDPNKNDLNSHYRELNWLCIRI